MPQMTNVDILAADELKELDTQLAKLNARAKHLKNFFKERYPDGGVFRADGVTIRIHKGSRDTVDTEKLKADNLYATYLKCTKEYLSVIID